MVQLPILALLAVLAVLALFFLVTIELPSLGLVSLGDREGIAGFLEGETPIGSTHEEVVRWLESRSYEIPKLAHYQVGPGGDDYPPTDAEGDSFMHLVVDTYRFVFDTDVEVFYTFEDGKLVSLKVRKMTDAL